MNREKNRFCDICGVFICPRRFASTEEWHQDIRIVYRADPDDTAILSGVGFMETSQTCHAPRDREHSYRSARSRLILFTLSIRMFICHAACWEVLCDRVSDNPSTRDLIPDVLYNILHCTPRSKFQFLRPRHDFGGAARFQSPYGKPFQSMSKEGLDHFVTEPAKRDVLREAIRFLQHNPRTTQGITDASRVQANPVIGSRDIFSVFPLEIICLLLTLLPSHDIEQLRLASRSIACISPTSLQLPQSFWWSRFAQDFEMGFALISGSDRGSQDWRALYSALRHALRIGYPRLRNRKRIWELVGKNGSLFSRHLRGIQLHGKSVPDNFGRTCRDMRGEIISTEFTAWHQGLLHIGSRQKSVKCLLRQPTRQIIHAVGVSTVSFNSRMFVSGFRVLFWDNSNIRCASHSLGYVTKDSETLLQIEDPNVFDGFELAACVDGIVGLRVMFKSGSHSSWAGNIGQGELEVAFGRLHMGERMNPFNIICSFDAFKMISFAVTNSKFEDPARAVPDLGSNATGGPPVNSGYNFPKFADLDETDDFPKGFVSQSLWTPCYPSQVRLVEIPKNPNYQKFNPILNMNFGGAHGEMLQLLTRIVVHMRDLDKAFVGFAFDYNGEVSLFGRQGRTEISFPIDGAKGERISEITSEQASTSLGIRSLYICTNFGNSMIFMPDELRPREKLPAVNYTKRTVAATEGQVITGFTAILEIHCGSFQTFDLQTMPDETPIAPNQRVSDGLITSAAKICSSVGSQIIREHSSGCQAYTYASLKGVKCIRFSCGSTTRANKISGLWLDYFEGPSKIVGQWLSEIDRMDFKYGERIIGISVFPSQSVSSGPGKSRRGPLVSAVSILASNQFKTVQLDRSKANCMTQHFRESRMERLSFIAWAFNGVADHLGTLSSPATEGFRFWHPRDDANILDWYIPDKILWEDGSDRVTSIAAYGLSYNKKVQHITRLVFGYQSGGSREIGDFRGEPSGEAVSIMGGERFVGIDLIWGYIGEYFGLLNITFHLERLENGEPIRRSHRFAGAKLPSTRDPFYHNEIDLSASRHKEYTTGPEVPGEVTSGELPRMEAIGLWGFNMKSGGSLSLGVIFSEGDLEDSK